MSAANKIKQYTALRQCAFNQISELKQFAERAKINRELMVQFKMMYESLNNICQDFKTQHNNLIALLCIQEDFNLELEESIRAKFDLDCSIVKTIYHNYFVNIEDTVIANRTDHTGVQSNVKLPIIEIPKFSGDVILFKTYIDTFNSLVHNNNTLSDIEKFTYLTSTLEGAPLRQVQCTRMAAENYQNAYNSLVNRYSNKRLIATAHLNAIDNAPNVTDSKNCRVLRSLLETFNENLAALQNMNFPVTEWDFVLFYFFSKHLDEETLTRFEYAHGSDNNTTPSFETLRNFVQTQCNALDAVQFSSQHLNKNLLRNKVKNTPPVSSIRFRQSSNFLVTENKYCCLMCKSDHPLYKCNLFLKQTPLDRFNFVKQHNLCVNCTGARHNFKNCKSTSVCRECKSKHHTLLHFNRVSSNNQNSSSQSENNVTDVAQTATIMPLSDQAVSSLSGVTHSNINVLLSTAQVEVLDAQGNYQKIRVLLDCGSQANFITNKCVNKLGLSRFRSTVSIHGLNNTHTSSTFGGATCSLRPVGVSSKTVAIDTIILPTICADMPTNFISQKSWSHINNLRLADPQFNIPRTIDLLLGADVFPHILLDGRVIGNKDEPSALNTIFGWVLMGNVSGYSTPRVNSLFCSLNTPDLENLIKRFWEIEEIPEKKVASPDDTLCEQIFSESLTKTNSGRYVVSLPFRTSIPFFNSSESRSLALRRFLCLEKKLVNSPELNKNYSEFMLDYLNNKHMVPIKHFTIENNCYYLPHHCVVKPENSTTKLRVVFDASVKLSNGFSLNDTLLTGPKLQQDIVTILLRFRLHTFVFTTDIKQMYRQILVKESQRNFQRILWRFSPSQPIQDFQLNTVTFGVSSAPFLAIRTLLQLAYDEQCDYPLAAQVLKTDTYVDDIITGSNSLTEARALQEQLINLLDRGGFQLRKWTSNNPQLLSHLPTTSLYNESLSFDQEGDSIVKILGLQWRPTLDTFSYTVDINDSICTKRTILSDLARIFDPLGFLAPLTFFAKHLIQHLWTLGLDWDETPPDTILNRWSEFKSELALLSSFQLPRRLICNEYISCEIHAFCDASEKGFATVIYLRVKENVSDYKTFFVCAKSKVAPLKTISIPRLELCGAVLLSNLLSLVLKTYDGKINFSQIYAWSDSTIVLHWLKSSPHKWKTFVGNRITHIQNLIAPSYWHHVPSSENPADCASRGVSPSELIKNTQWWAGPMWMSRSKTFWPKGSYTTAYFPSNEEKTISLANCVVVEAIDVLLKKYSSLSKIKRIIAYALRFIQNSRRKRALSNFVGAFTDLELNRALLALVTYVQMWSFADDIAKLKKGQTPSKIFRKLNAFIDSNGIVRVGGRLQASQLPYDKKHPALLPSCNRLTDLIIEDTHIRHMHPGIQTLHFLIIQNFWILSAKRVIRRVLIKCVKCWRLRPTPFQPPMGNLPARRISQGKPFSSIGVDYGGPFNITLGKAKGAKILKAYICIFVCFATKAVHVELASDLSTEAFLAALRRFIARRGRCSQIYSDCGTNFIGAQKLISQYMKNAAEAEAIKWHFNPPSAPHFGGLWEAGIKSFKTHLYRIIGEQILTYEELYTVLTQIEALLNSRPLCAVSTDPNDLAVLSPGHFLTLEPLTAFPDPDLTDIKLNRLTRWQLLQRLHQDFWTRWHREYLHTLHQKGKWLLSSTPVLPGTMVLIKNDCTPPLRWHLGRIVEVHPGADGVIRVATVRTNQGNFKRPLVKLCPLPNSQTD